MRMVHRTLAVLLLAGSMTATASAQSADRSSGYYGPYSVYGPGLTYKQPSAYYGPYSVYGPGLTYRQAPTFATRPESTFLRVQTSVSVPDGGEALVAGYSLRSEGRNEFGVPGLGKVPYLDRGFRNVGAGTSIRRTTVSVRARIIILSEEEERQTGVHP